MITQTKKHNNILNFYLHFSECACYGEGVPDSGRVDESDPLEATTWTTSGDGGTAARVVAETS